MRLLEAHLPMSNKEYRISNREFFTGKKVLVMGLGRFGGGVDVTKFACDAGAEVTVTDLASADDLSDSIKQLEECPRIKYHLGCHNVPDFEQADIVVVNPAVTPDNEFLERARERNKFITSQISIFFELCPARIIGITGANGKSTTAALTSYLLKAAIDKSIRSKEDVIASEAKQSQSTRYAIRDTRYEKVWLSGNIGNEPLLTVIDQIGSDDLVVLELSSFQIERLAQIQKGPQVALLTNLTPNHLDRYGAFISYCAAKENIFKFQKLDDNRPAVSIFNAEDEIGAEWFEKYKKDKGRICLKFSADDVSEQMRGQFGLPGQANLSNLAAAVAVAKYFGVTDEQIKSCLPDFKPLPHRLELVAEIDGVRWYNDSKATTPEGAIVALEAFEQPKIIVAGGYDKHIPFDELGRKIAQEAKAAILIGQTAEKIADAICKTQDSRHKTQDSKLKTHIEIVKSLADAVNLVKQIAESGDVVLLSPACASYDMFDNFEHRAQEFTKLVQGISEQL